MREDNPKVKGNHFHKEAMISLKFEKIKYNAFMSKIKAMRKKNSMDLVTRLKSEDGSMIPQKEASSIQ